MDETDLREGQFQPLAGTPNCGSRETGAPVTSTCTAVRDPVALRLDRTREPQITFLDQPRWS